ncbi:uncharacterized protein K444DRAFT_638002 [Hyaloscypha bicolor E]|uniref:Uncharacterized protein n=1 Tax=Hyaloscypha bicolor E TaxID=1095630 RepID=A0A2J6SIQ7_9HELO|nr:uncharacterized protein K444DRAFT_638002 [Hyaloscypha bicolor E]PMD50656.1 hypothetical protein K444DRAFT_638002 [Hyaloscypha bicolor E]
MLTESARTNENSPPQRNTKVNDVHMKENYEVIEYMEVGDDEEYLEDLQTTDLASAQELTARNVNPMKLVTLLRVRFGIGRYEIQRMRNVYNIRTPRRLSVEEIARCRWD